MPNPPIVTTSKNVIYLLGQPVYNEDGMADEPIIPGMLVTVRPLDEANPDDETYLLAEHSEEKAPGARTVTTSSPLGTALLGAAAEQEVAYEAPAGTIRYMVVGFEPFAG